MLLLFLEEVFVVVVGFVGFVRLRLPFLLMAPVNSCFSGISFNCGYDLFSKVEYNYMVGLPESPSTELQIYSEVMILRTIRVISYQT